MFTSKSGSPSASAITDVKSLLETMGNPDKLKSAMKALEDRVDEAAKAEKDAIEAIKELSAKQKVLLEKEAEMAKAASSLEGTAKSIQNSAASLSEQRKELAEQKKTFAESVGAFQEGRAVLEKQLSEKIDAADKRMKQADDLHAKSKAAVQEYEAKLSKLKAAMG